MLLRRPPASPGEWQINAPPGILIDTATIPQIETAGIVSSSAYGWRAADYWSGGHTTWEPSTSQISEGINYPLDSSYFGFKLFCYASKCNNSGYVKVFEVDLTAIENQQPILEALGSNNLWYQTGHWIWNPSGDPWPFLLAASDPSGICNMYALVNELYIQGPDGAAEHQRLAAVPQPNLVERRHRRHSRLRRNERTPVADARGHERRRRLERALGDSAGRQRSRHRVA